MNFNYRLVDSSRNPLARELLRSADLDEPPEHSYTRLAVALGLGTSAVVTTAATSATATMGLVASSGAATATTTTASAGAGAAVGAGVVASSTTLSSVGGAAVAAGAAPVVSGAVTALGMLKAMAVVSLTCGTLSYGGTKLAMTIADKPVAASVSAAPARVSTDIAKAQVRRAAAGAALDTVAAPPAPPEPQIDDDDVAAAPVREVQLSDESNDTAQRIVNERNLGRQDINANGGVNLAGQAGASQDALVPQAVSNTNPSAGPRVSAVGAFPSDDEQPAPAATTAQPSKGAARRAKADKAQADSDLEREVALLDRARVALASWQPLVALQALDAYQKQPSRGTLRAESVVLRVKALLALGQRSAAEREAYPLINAAPQSRHAVRLRELLGVPANAP